MDSFGFRTAPPSPTTCAAKAPSWCCCILGLWERRTWDRQVDTFADAGFRVVRYDTRGYGGSSRLRGEPYSHVRDLRALLDALEIPIAALVGCSVGGATAIDFALEAGEIGRAQELRLEIWASLGTSDEAGSTIRRIAFDNIHEVTMDERAEEGIDPARGRSAARDRGPDARGRGTTRSSRHATPEGPARSGDPGARLGSIDADHVVNVRAPEAFDAAVVPFLRQHAPS